MIRTDSSSDRDAFDVIVVGAGFAGLYLLHRLRALGFSARAFEIGDGVGGTWYWNRYPGARCDVQSLEYSYQFDEALQQEWDWSERYATQAEHLYVFQRTPNYSIPAHNGPIPPAEVARVKADYAGFRARNWAMPAGFSADLPGNPDSLREATPEERERAFQRRWDAGGLPFLGAFADIGLDPESNRVAAEFVRQKIRETVKDPEVAELLCPDQTIGYKRLCVDTGYYETFNRDDVTLVDIRETGIERLDRTGVCARGEEYAVDVIVFATGFDAMTGALLAVDIRGRDGLPLGEKWAEGPKTYLGLATSGFPNLFTVTGPGSPSVLSNMVPSIEHHVDWMTDCMAWLRDARHETIEATREAEEAWVAHVDAVADVTLYSTCNSWYLGANVPGKPRVFMPLLGVPAYVEKCKQVAEKGYEGFAVA